MILVNGNIVTMRRRGDVASAMQIDSEKIVAVGGVDTRGRKVIDLQGRTVIPGFTDAHTHFCYWVETMQQVDLTTCKSLDEALRLIGARAAQLPKGHWLEGRGFNKNNWNPPDFPTRFHLDSAASDHPVAVFSKDEHSLWSNSLALAKAGIDRGTADPPGGKIERDTRGEPSGIFFEMAYELVTRAIPPAPTDDFLVSMSDAARSVHKLGVTGIHDVGTWEAWNAYSAWEDHLLDVVKYFPVDQSERVVGLNLKSCDGTPFLRIGGLKLFSDGALGSQTAYMWEPYEGSNGNTGVSRLSSHELDEYLDFATRHGLACAVHAIGDHANSMVIDAAARYAATALRHRVEHAQIVRTQDVTRLASSGWTASVQPSHLVSDRDMALRYWGEKRSRDAYPFKSLLDAGVPLAFGSDVPIEPIDPLFGIYAACARKHPNDDRGPWEPAQCLDRYSAVHAFTAGAAYAAGLERETGTLAPGQRANFVVLDRDIMGVPDEELLNIRVLATFVAGKPLYVNDHAAPDLAETLNTAFV
jgi:hypothetical protein